MHDKKTNIKQPTICWLKFDNRSPPIMQTISHRMGTWNNEQFTN